MDYQHVKLEIDDPVATITLNRPEKLNALTLRTTDELRHALLEADGNEAVVGIVLTGAGRGFCAGLDLSEIEEFQEAGTTDVSGEACDLTVTKPHHDHEDPGHHVELRPSQHGWKWHQNRLCVTWLSKKPGGF